ncbi:uncharacterized protein LOC134279048 [Saccostrea cucullata]|uniref:uncharacterized protein LOC134279048 n=1 Tax=Saccostrea cuccullata TaxID=36930 RepID=UPI002ED53CDF
MDFHAAMETFAEAWVAANTPTAVNTSEISQVAPTEEIPSQIQMEQKIKKRSSSNSPGQGLPTAGATGVKSLPIHCVIEQTSGPLTFEPENTATYSVELDTYAILPCTTLFSELVRTALIKLGYNANEAMNAKGAIQIKNWKPLNFESITDDNKCTIEDILGDLTQTAKLRIRLCSTAKLSSTDEIKGKLLQLLLTQSQGILMSSGCPIEKDLLASLSKGDSFSHLPPEIRKSFDKWYQDLQKHSEEARHSNASTPEKNPSPPPREPQSYLTNHAPLHGKTRMRTSFDPEHEIPRLQKWFSENQHPPREMMIKYLEELNSLDSRKGRRPLDLTNIIYWFKNARAAHRRASKCFDGDTSFEGDEATEESTNAPDNGCFMNTRNLPYMLPYPFQGIYSSHDILGDALKEPCDLSKTGQRARMNVSKKEDEADIASKPDIEKVKTESSKSSDAEMDKSDDERSNEGHGISIKKESASISDGEKTPEVGDAPYLPNRNAVYILPHQYGQYKNSHDDDEEPREPCDLSNSHKSSQGKKEMLDTANNNRKRKSVSDDEQEKENSNGKADSVNRYNTERRRSSQDYPNHSRRSSNGNSEVFNSGSDDDEMESDIDDSQSYAGSESSHEMKDGAPIREAHMGSYNTSTLSRLQHSAAGLHQPLHIPHFPHPLAMTYFPMNSHFLQQTTRYQQQQNSQAMSSDESPTDHHIKSDSLSSSHRKRRTRVFIDPMSEIPKLEKWFAEDTHPSSYMIDKYCEELNKSEYRQKFPKLEAKNVQLWFKNHRAKVKRMRVSSVDLHGMEY